MKKALFILSLFILSNNLYSQYYYYSKRTESVKYVNSEGVSTSKVIKANSGNFKLYFEKSGIDGKDVFTEYINDIDNGYYTLVKKYENREFKGKIFEQGLFFSTDNQGGVMVSNTLNKDRLIIFKGDKIIQYDR